MVSRRKVYSNGVSRNGRLYNSKARTSQRYNHRDAEIIFKRLGTAELRGTQRNFKGPHSGERAAQAFLYIPSVLSSSRKSP